MPLAFYKTAAPPDKFFAFCTRCGKHRHPCFDDWVEFEQGDGIYGKIPSYIKNGFLTTPARRICTDECPDCFEELNEYEDRLSK